MPRQNPLTALLLSAVQDARHSARSLFRARALTVTVVMTLGLGIGANTVMFDVVDRLMYRPLAYLKDPATVHRIYWQWQDRGNTTTTTTSPYTRYLDVRRSTASFAGLAAFSERPLAVGEGEAARELRVGCVSASFFELFSARPVLGRFFTASEDTTPRGADVVILSFAFWQSQFGARDVLGEVLQVGNVRATIIGVAPSGFNGVNDADPPSLYMPITTYAASTGTGDATSYFTTYQWGWVNTLARRKANVTVTEAEADATRAFVASWTAARTDSPTSPTVENALPHAVVSSVRSGAGPNPALEARTALWLSAVSVIVLLIACANVANLLLARALNRQRETTIRLALGVSRGRLIAQSMTEGFLLSAAGAALAILLANWANLAFQRLLVGGAAPDRFILDGRTLSMTIAMAIASGVLVGLVPAVLLGRGDLSRILRGGARGGVSEGVRLRATLLLVQTTLSVVLLVGAALFVRSLDAVKNVRMGYDADQVLLVNRVVRGAAFDDATQLAMRNALLSTAKSLSNVESAAWVSSAPFVSTSSTNLFVPEIGAADTRGRFSYQATTPEYFATMGTRILRGRGLTADDRRGTPDVAVVSVSMANALWPQQDAIGKCFRMRSESAPCVTVVGIAEDMMQRSLTDAERGHYYVSIDQYTRTWGIGMLLKLRGDPAREAENIRRALQRAMPGSSYVVVRPLLEIVGEQQRSWRLGATVFFYFGILALVVAGIGLYGVIAYNVAHRRHELSVRTALGAGRRDIVTLVVGQGIRFAVGGTALGLAAAFAASRWIQPLLFQQPAADPAIYAGVATVMIVVALTASTLPALSASRADPNAALRAE